MTISSCQDTAENNAKMVFNQLDIDRDGELNEDEFVKGCLKVSKKRSFADLTTWFSGFKLAKFAQWILRMNDLRMQECRNKTSKKQQSVRD